MRIILLVILLGGGIVSTQSQPVLSEQQGQVAALPISYCALLNNPEKYIRKSVTIKAIYVVGFEMAFLQNEPECEAEEFNNLIGLKFADSWKEETSPEVRKKMDNLLGIKADNKSGIKKAKIVFVGELYGKREKIKQGDKWVNPKYDGRYQYQLVIRKIESIVKL